MPLVCVLLAARSRSLKPSEAVLKMPAKGFERFGWDILIAKAHNCRNNNWLKDLGNYSEWPEVAGTVIKASTIISLFHPSSLSVRWQRMARSLAGCNPGWYRVTQVLGLSARTRGRCSDRSPLETPYTWYCPLNLVGVSPTTSL